LASGKKRVATYLSNQWFFKMEDTRILSMGSMYGRLACPFLGSRRVIACGEADRADLGRSNLIMVACAEGFE